MKRKILQYPNDKLTIRSDIVAFPQVLSMTTRQLISDMIETLVTGGGIGLAAPQLGEMVRIIIINTTTKPIENSGIMEVMVNPVIEKKDGEVDSIEGCLSFKQYEERRYIVKRAKEIWVSYFDHNGEYHNNRHLKGIEAICVQHEIDHLNGITMNEAGVPMKKEEIKD